MASSCAFAAKKERGAAPVAARCRDFFGLSRFFCDGKLLVPRFTVIWPKRGAEQKVEYPMKKTDLMKVTLLAGLIAIGGAASAKSGDGNAMFDKVDADSNGEITQAELRAHAEARFAAADTNNDGSLSSEELLANRVGNKADRMLKRFDADGNGQLSAEELEAAADDRMGKRAKRMMARLDADKDGKLTLDEMNAARDPAKMFERLDTDDSGSLSAEEFAKARKGMRHTQKN